MKQAGELGFHKVELFLNAYSEIEKPYISCLKKICREYGIAVISVHFYTAAFESMMFFSAYERRTKDSIEKYMRYFDALKPLSPACLTFHGERAGLSGLNIDHLPFAKITEVYNELCLAAKRFGMEISQENVAWCRSKSPEYVKKLGDAVPELRFTLDIKQAVRAGYPPESFIEAMGKSLRNIHICDYDSDNSCLLPGKGNMDYYNFNKLLKHQNYQKDIIIEVYSSNFVKTDDIIISGNFLQNIFNCRI